MAVQQKSPLKRMFVLIGFAVLYVAAARFGLLLAYEGTNASPVWPPSGLAVAAVVLFGAWAAPFVGIGAIVANIWSFAQNNAADPVTILLMSLVISIGNTLEALIGGILMRKNVPGHPLQGTGDVYRFLAIAAFVAMISAGFGNLSLFMGGVVAPGSIFQVMATWWVGDFVGIMIVAPLALLPGAMSLKNLMGKLRKPWFLLEMALSLAFLVGAALLIFTTSVLPWSVQRLLLFVFFPVLSWLAFRNGLALANTGVFLVAIIAVLGTVHGTGPFHGVVLNNSLISLEIYLLLLSLAGLILSADSLLITAYESGERRRLFFRSHWLALLLGIAATIGGWQWVSSETANSYDRNFKYQANELVSFVENRMRDYEQILRSAAGFFSSSEEVTRAEWKRYFLIEQIEHNYPGVQGLGFGARISARDLQVYEEKQRRDGRPGYMVQTSGDQSYLVPVTYLEPENTRNEKAIGYDMYSEQKRRTAIDEATISGNASITSLITLVTETDVDRQPGMILFFPVYQRGVTLDSYERRRQAIQGYIYAPFRAYDMFRTTLADRLDFAEVRVWDGNVRTDENMLFQSSASPRSDPRFVFTGIVSVGKRNWTVELHSTLAFESTVDETKETIFLISGVVISMLLFTAMRSLTATRAEALRVSDAMSSALAEKNAFQQSILDTVDSSIISTTVSGLITSFSKGSEQLLGYRSDEVVGKYTLTFFHDQNELESKAPESQGFDQKQSESGFQVLTRGLDSHEDQSGEWTYATKSGARIPVFLTMSAIRNREGKITGYLAVARDLTESKRTLQALRDSESFNRNIVDNTRDRIFILDTKGVILEAPTPTLKALGLDDTLLSGGMEFWQLLKPPHFNDARNALSAAVTGRTGKLRAQLGTSHEGKLWWDILLSPILGPGERVLKVLSVLRDVTIEHERDSAVRKLNMELEARIKERTQQLQESNTQLKVHADELEKRRDFLQRIADNLPVNVAYWLKDDRTLSFVNENYLKFIGKQRDAVMGKPFAEAVGPSFYALNKEFFEAGLEGNKQEFERTFRKPNGEIGYLLISFIPHFENDRVVGLFSVGADITKTKTAEMGVQKLNELLQVRIREKSDELLYTEAVFSSAMTASAAGMAIVDKFNCYERINPALCNFLQYNEMELKNKSVFDSILPDDGEIAREVFEALWNAESFSARLELRYVRQDNAVVWGLLNLARVINAKGQTEHLVAHVADIQQQKQLEKEMADLIEQLRDQKAELERSNKELDSFAYAASHDLKSPLRGIGKLAAWVEEDLGNAISEDIRTNLHLMRKRIGQMEGLLQDLLTFAKAGREDDAWQTLDLEQKFLEIWGLTAGSDRFKLKLPSKLPHIVTPRVALEQVLRNLIGNAVKHHDKEKGTIKVTFEQIGDVCRFEIIDDGPGIKPEFQQKIFEMFQTLKSKDESEGSGIGLALVKKVVERYGGSIGVESDGRRGTKFVFNWPAEFIG